MSEKRVVDCDNVSVMLKDSDPRLSKMLTLAEFNVAFKVYEDVICKVYPSCRAELDTYLAIISDLALTYGGTLFYDYHKSFSAKAATFSVDVLPVNVSYVSAFIVHCFESRKMQPSTIKSMVAGIQFHLRCLDPSTISLLENPSIRLLLNRLKKEKPQGNDHHLPLTLPLLQKVISRLREECFGLYSDMMLESVLLTAFYGFLRDGEFSTRTDTYLYSVT